jgi:hypothetical protein
MKDHRAFKLLIAETNFFEQLPAQRDFYKCDNQTQN